MANTNTTTPAKKGIVIPAFLAEDIDEELELAAQDAQDELTFEVETETEGEENSAQENSEPETEAEQPVVPVSSITMDMVRAALKKLDALYLSNGMSDRNTNLWKHFGENEAGKKQASGFLTKITAIKRETKTLGVDLTASEKTGSVVMAKKSGGKKEKAAPRVQTELEKKYVETYQNALEGLRGLTDAQLATQQTVYAELVKLGLFDRLSQVMIEKIQNERIEAAKKAAAKTTKKPKLSGADLVLASWLDSKQITKDGDNYFWTNKGRKYVGLSASMTPKRAAEVWAADEE